MQSPSLKYGRDSPLRLHQVYYSIKTTDATSRNVADTGHAKLKLFLENGLTPFPLIPEPTNRPIV